MTEENKNIYISYWLLLITLLVALMIIIGGLTRLTDSGLSITRWDLISGILPPLSFHHWEELFSLRGGIIPEKSSHLVIDRPESVSLVNPPTTIITATNIVINKSQYEI